MEQNVAACADMEPQLDKLRIKVLPPLPFPFLPFPFLFPSLFPPLSLLSPLFQSKMDMWGEGLTGEKAVVKIREFLLQQVYSLKKPGANPPMIIANELTRYAWFSSFLYRFARDYFVEIRDVYVDIMLKLYSSKFREYLTGLMNLHNRIDIGSKNDLIGLPEGLLKDILFLFSLSLPLPLSSLSFPLSPCPSPLLPPHIYCLSRSTPIL